MIKLIKLMLLFLLITSCDKNKIVKGDLYFKIVNFNSPKGLTEKQVNKFDSVYDSLQKKLNKSQFENEFISNYNLLKKNKIFGLPYIRIAFKDKSNKIIYLTLKQHNKIALFELDKLLENNQKVEISLIIKKIENNIFFSDSIISYKLISGKTYFEK